MGAISKVGGMMKSDQRTSKGLSNHGTVPQHPKMGVEMTITTDHS